MNKMSFVLVFKCFYCVISFEGHNFTTHVFWRYEWSNAFWKKYTWIETLWYSKMIYRTTNLNYWRGLVIYLKVLLKITNLAEFFEKWNVTQTCNWLSVQYYTWFIIFGTAYVIVKKQVTWYDTFLCALCVDRLVYLHLTIWSSKMHILGEFNNTQGLISSH